MFPWQCVIEEQIAAHDEISLERRMLLAPFQLSNLSAQPELCLLTRRLEELPRTTAIRYIKRRPRACLSGHNVEFNTQSISLDADPACLQWILHFLLSGWTHFSLCLLPSLPSQPSRYLLLFSIRSFFVHGIHIVQELQHGMHH